MSNAFSELCTIKYTSVLQIYTIYNSKYVKCFFRIMHNHLSRYLCVKNTCMYSKYLFQQISKFLEDSMDAFYGIRTLKSIDYSKNN